MSININFTKNTGQITQKKTLREGGSFSLNRAVCPMRSN